MNLEALIVLPQVTQAIRSRAVHVVRDRFAAPGFARVLTESSRSASPPPSIAPAARSVHTVKEGDFLTRIVRDHLEAKGRPVTNRAVLDAMHRVSEANGIANPDLIHPGEQIDLTVLNGAAALSREPTGGQGGRSVAPYRGKGRLAPLHGFPRVSKAVEKPANDDTTTKSAAAENVSPWQQVLGPGVEVSSPYGYRRDPFTGSQRFHHGVDLAVPTGTKIRPLEAGEVVFSGWKAGYGRAVIVRHDGGAESVYGHASRTLAKVGARVTAQDTIALSGSSGRSTGPHVHLEVRRNGEAINPESYLQSKEMYLARKD